jgi:SAM-dependent methyltransferase
MTDLPNHDLITEHLASADFVKAVLSVPIERGDSPWEKVTIRRVELQRGSMLQVARFDGRQVDTKSVEAGDALLDEIARLKFRHVTVHLADAKIESRITKKGKVLSTRTAETTQMSTDHDRPKARLIPENAPFLEVLGLASGGVVKPTGQRKYRQVNEFIGAILGTPGIDEALRQSPLRVVDFGCGNAYLTFATYHYLHEILGLSCEVRGIDRNQPLMERANQRAAQLGWTGLSFDEGNIGDATVGETPHIVIALHACDTATDDALARAVTWGSPLVLVSPCCHHDVQRQLKVSSSPTDYSSIVRKGLLKERLGDVLTDSLRCDVLAMLGYQTEVIEFISLEHTAKNLMIRAGHTGRQPTAENIRQYTAMRDQWNIEPYLERALAQRLEPILARAKLTQRSATASATPSTTGASLPAPSGSPMPLAAHDAPIGVKVHD